MSTQIGFALRRLLQDVAQHFTQQIKRKALSVDQLGWDNSRLGEIQIDDFIENYWKTQLKKLVNGCKSVLLKTANNMAWVCYREDSMCYIHQILILDDNQDIRERETIDEDGNKISEWSITFDEINKFINSST